MRTTINIDDELLAKAVKLAAPLDRTAVVHDEQAVILVDTSVWVDHLRRGDVHLAALLGARRGTRP